MSNFKTRFVKEVLEDEGKRLLKNQGMAMRKRLKFHTAQLINSRTAHTTSDDQMDGQLTLNHKAYQRFLDIKRKVRNRKTNRISSRSPRIHNRFVFGHYYSIANRLMNEAYDEANDAIRKDLNSLSNG